jgi:hypothetical protein
LLKVDDFGVGRDCDVASYGFDFAGADEDSLAGENGARVRIDQLTGADGGDLGGGGNKESPASRREHQTPPGNGDS